LIRASTGLFRGRRHDGRPRDINQTRSLDTTSGWAAASSPHSADVLRALPCIWRLPSAWQRHLIFSARSSDSRLEGGGTASSKASLRIGEVHIRVARGSSSAGLCGYDAVAMSSYHRKGVILHASSEADSLAASGKSGKSGQSGIGIPLSQQDLVQRLVALHPDRYPSPGWAVRALLDKSIYEVVALCGSHPDSMNLRIIEFLKARRSGASGKQSRLVGACRASAFHGLLVGNLYV